MVVNLSNNTDLEFKISDKYLFRHGLNVLEQLTGDEAKTIGTNEANLLRLFVQNPAQVISRSVIQKHVWEDNGFQVDDSSLTQAIFNLRKLLGDSSKAPAYILTVPRQGYKFIAPVEAVKPEATESPVPKAAQAESPVVSQPVLPAALEGFAGKGNKVHRYKAAIYLLICLIFPAFTFFVASPAESQYITIQTVNGISIRTLDGIEPNEDWQLAIEQCVQAFILDQPKPETVIANGGRLQKLSLNFVYSPEQSGHNKTLRLIASKPGAYAFCDNHGVTGNE